MFDPGKEYETCDHRPVRIYAIDGIGTQCIHGAIYYSNKEPPGWIMTRWDINGIHPTLAELNIINLNLSDKKIVEESYLYA